MPGPGTLQAGQFAGTLTTALGTATVTENPYDLTHPPLRNDQYLLSPELYAGFETPTLTGIQFLDTAAVIDTSGTTTRTLSTKPALVDGCTVVLLSSGNLNPLATVTPPTGFTAVNSPRTDNGSNTHIDVFVKYVASAAAEASVSWTITSSGTDKGVHRFLVFTGVDQTTPFNAQNGAAETGAGTSPWTHTTPSITTTVDNTVLIWTVIDRQTTVGSYSGMLDYQWDDNPDNTRGTNAIAAVSHISDQVPTGTYSRSATVTGGGTYSNAVMWIGALNPAPAGTNFTDTETDSSGVTDSTTTEVGYARTQTDSTGATDSLSTALAFARTQDDTAGLTDAATAASSFVRTQDDSSGLTDTVDVLLAKIVQQDDPAGLTDSTSTAIAYARTQTDTAGSTDTVAPAAAYARTQDDAAGITDAVVTQLGKLVQQDDTTGLTDSTTTALGYGRTQTDDAGITDTATSALAVSRSLSDDAGLTDSLTSTIVPSLATSTVDDVVFLADEVLYVLTGATYLFTPPRVRKRAEQGERWNPFHQRIGVDVGLSVIKIGTSYRTVEDPDPADIALSSAFYLGGRSYTIDQTERDALVAAGYGSYIQ